MGDFFIQFPVLFDFFDFNLFKERPKWSYTFFWLHAIFVEVYLICWRDDISNKPYFIC